MVEEMTSKETTNIILKLTQEGWDANKINEFNKATNVNINLSANILIIIILSIV